MKNIPSYISTLVAIVFVTILFNSCRKDELPPNPFDNKIYVTEDQMGRPAVNTVFNVGADKDLFNVTTPSQMGAIFQPKFQSRLMALNPGYTTNALGLDASTFTTVLATDVLNVSTTGKTTFYDGTNVLTGRALNDDVIDVELTLVFGGPSGTSSPGLTSDHVDHNDKNFLNHFPYLASPW